MIGLIAIGLVSSAIYGLLMFKYGTLWRDITFKKSKETPAVSVVVVFRNEAENLPRLLESLNQQDYPKDKVKILFVNDHSEDGGTEIMAKYNWSFSNELLHLDQSFGKKAGVKLAWKSVKTELVVHTDADCAMGTKWLSALVAPFTSEDCGFVSGPVVYEDTGNFWKRLLALDFISLIGIGAAHIAWGRPLICNGANLAYRSSWIGQLKLKEEKASGEDVFMMQSIANGGAEIAFCKNQEAVITTAGPRNFSEFVHQRLRWASKNTAYSGKGNNAILIFSWLYNMLILSSLLVWTKISVTLFFFMIVVKILSESAFYTQLSVFFKWKHFTKTLILGQVFHIVYMSILPLSAKLIKFKWKERKWS